MGAGVMRGGPVVLAMLAAACTSPVVNVDADATGGSTSGEGTSTGIASETSDATTDVPEPETSSGDVPSDMGVDVPPLPTSRLDADVETPGGHALVLHEIVDGEPRPPQQLTGDVPGNAAMRVIPLGSADRIAFDLQYVDGTHDLFIVDWSEGHPATTAQIDDAVPASYSIGPPTWLDELDALVVRIADGYYRIDANDGAAAEPIALLDDLPFGITLDEYDTRVVMPIGPWLVVRGLMFPDVELYLADIADPSEPVVQLTEYVDRGPSETPMQLASGDLVFQTGAVEGPDEVHMVLREGEGWSAPIVVPTPADLPGADATLLAVRPGSDDFLVRVATADDPPVERWLVHHVEEGVLGEPFVIHEGDLTRLTLSTDGMHMLYAAEDFVMHAITFTDGVPGRPRALDGLTPGPSEEVRLSKISTEWVYARIDDPETSDMHALVRVGLDGGPRQVVAEIEAPGWIREGAIAPDDRWVALTTSSAVGLTTQVIDLTGDEPAAPVIAEHGDGPVIWELIPSPDSNFLASVTTNGGYPEQVVVVRSDDPGTVVLDVEDLADAPVWLP